MPQGRRPHVYRGHGKWVNRGERPLSSRVEHCERTFLDAVELLVPLTVTCMLFDRPRRGLLGVRVVVMAPGDAFHDHPIEQDFHPS